MNTPHKKSRGVIVLTALVTLMVGATVLIVQKAKSSRAVTSSPNSRAVLVEAKTALLNYATSYYYNDNNNRYGFLPCPDRIIANSEGVSDGNCTSKNVNALGKFPWRTLGLRALQDSSGECLWYAVTGAYKNGNSATITDMLNEDTNGAFKIFNSKAEILQGSNPEERVVAVVIAPQTLIASQASRNKKASGDLCSPDYYSSRFLEKHNEIDNQKVSGFSWAIDAFIKADYLSEKTVNDQIITITRADIFNKIMKSKKFTDLRDRTTEALARCIQDYGLNGTEENDASLPWAAPMELDNYYEDEKYNDEEELKFGRYPFIIDTSLSDNEKDDFTEDSDNLNEVPSGSGNFVSQDDNNIDDIFDQCSNWTWVDPDGVDPDVDVSMKDISTPERQFWKDWKDHFFYAASKRFNADDDENVTDDCGEDCIKVKKLNDEDQRVAAIVFFSGSRLASQEQTRNAQYPSKDGDTKKKIANYLEDKNNTHSGDTKGKDYIKYVNKAESSSFNDILYCIQEKAGMATARCK